RRSFGVPRGARLERLLRQSNIGGKGPFFLNFSGPGLSSLAAPELLGRSVRCIFSWRCIFGCKSFLPACSWLRAPRTQNFSTPKRSIMLSSMHHPHPRRPEARSQLKPRYCLHEHISRRAKSADDRERI